MPAFFQFMRDDVVHEGGDSPDAGAEHDADAAAPIPTSHCAVDVPCHAPPAVGGEAHRSARAYAPSDRW